MDNLLIQRKITLVYSFSIKFFADFSTKKGKMYIGGILIITDTYVIYVEDLKHLRYACPLLHINKCEVY